MAEDAESVVAELVALLEVAGCEVRPAAGRGRYVITARDGVAVSPPTEVFLDPDLVTEYLARSSRELEASLGGPPQQCAVEAKGLLITNLEEEVAVPDSTLPTHLGVWRDHNGHPNFFSEGSELISTDLPEDQRAEHFVWVSHPPDRDRGKQNDD